MNDWDDVQRWLDQKAPPPPTRVEVLGAFPELLPKPKPEAGDEESA